MKKHLFILLFGVLAIQLHAQYTSGTDLRKLFQSPPPSASPWVFWYWYQGSISREGITADLKAMKESGIAGAYLMPIKGPADPPLMDSVLVQLSPQWWAMVKHAFGEARRLGISLGLHASDGFALAGGPWITPELSMKKLVWTLKHVRGGALFNEVLEQPTAIENYYRDVAVFAFPSRSGAGVSTRTIIPKITSSRQDSAAQWLIQPGNKRNFSSDEACWIQYEFEQPFTCRSIIVRSRNNYQSNRLIVQAGNDGKVFQTITRLKPPRHGWQDWDADYTHAITPTTARYFRFIYNSEGSEPGAEDLDAAKWRQSLKISGLELLSESRVDGYEGKNGEVWRITDQSTVQLLPDSLCVPVNTIIDLTGKTDRNGRLQWKVPAGEWTILRIGNTSTGHRNETGGGGKGLECDKFNPAAVTLQFNQWFGAFYRQVDPSTIRQVLRFFHVDSWECGSQNWSPVFRSEFKKRRGYDLYRYLPAMAGIPVGSADTSERFLYDIRKTIAELVNDQFYVTLSRLAHQKGVQFTAESVAPTMLSDGMLHYKNVDIPMGEFWFRSPTHDKPNDMLDAISGAHIYGKNIVQAEAFTELRMAWDEHPGMLKSLADRNYALGINRFSYHVFMHNPWMDRKPGMTLDQIGLYFQRDQTWWKTGRAWVDYAKRCQALLQFGKPVIDIAVFTGDDYPRRAVLPDRLISVLPGIFGKQRVESENRRLRNEGLPVRQLPAGVTHSANMAYAEDWIDPLRGYAYDSYNTDALLRLSETRNGMIELKTGATYRLLVVPGSTKMSPTKGMISAEAATKIMQLANNGATVVMQGEWHLSTGLSESGERDKKLKSLNDLIISKSGLTSVHSIKVGKGQVIRAPYHDESFASIGIDPDVLAWDSLGKRAEKIAWTHRQGSGVDIYFISNQKDSFQNVLLSLRVKGKIPELWDPVTGRMYAANTWLIKNGRTELPLRLEKNASLFVVLQQGSNEVRRTAGANWTDSRQIQALHGPWTVRFDSVNAGPKHPVIFEELKDWSRSADSSIRFYSGTAAYSKTIEFRSVNRKTTWLNLGVVHNLAEVFVNNISCGIAWTAPYRVDISRALKEGTNYIRIEVVNTWNNRMVGDSRLPAETRTTRFMYPFKWENRPLLPAGLLGPVTMEAE